MWRTIILNCLSGLVLAFFFRYAGWIQHAARSAVYIKSRALPSLIGSQPSSSSSLLKTEPFQISDSLSFLLPTDGTLPQQPSGGVFLHILFPILYKASH